uniref:EH domain-containing protein n=1 Tax=Timema douglasi TaxID=61478 RepID=A0A7R8VQ94_TIMDO|nr:unnamed protein product [Timema douglasi]
MSSRHVYFIKDAIARTWAEKNDVCRDELIRPGTTRDPSRDSPHLRLAPMTTQSRLDKMSAISLKGFYLTFDLQHISSTSDVHTSRAVLAEDSVLPTGRQVSRNSDTVVSVIPESHRNHLARQMQYPFRADTPSAPRPAFGMRLPTLATPNMWPQQQQGVLPASKQVATDDQKHREYLKQQQRLRLMAASTNKTLPRADGPSVAAPSFVSPVYPPWMVPSSPLLPAVYRQTWTLVGQLDGFADTNRVSAVLLTSGLPTEVLGYIWSLANRQVAGKLTEQELYVMLALVALAQSGCTFNSLGVLNLIPQPPIPNITLPSVTPTTIEPVSNHQGKMRREELNTTSLSNTTSISETAPSISNLDDDFDDFTDFQSATIVPSSTLPPINNLNITPIASTVPQVTATPKTTEEKLESSTSFQKFPSVIVVGSTSRGIGSRLANHSLSAPKQSKPHHKHHHHHHHRNTRQQANTNFASVAADEDFSDFQQAKDVPVKEIDNMFPKCSVKPPQGKTYLLKESAIRTDAVINQSDVKTNTQPKLLLIDDDKTVKLEHPQEVIKEENISVVRIAPPTTRTSIPPINDTPDCETKLATGSMLMSVDEDRYSALRDLSFGTQDSIIEETPTLNSTSVDDFGDFHSAEDSFADIAKRESTTTIVSSLLDNSPVRWQVTDGTTSEPAKFAVDWDTFDFGGNSETMPTEETFKPTSNLADATSLNFAAGSRKDSDLSSDFLALNFDGDKAFDSLKGSNLIVNQSTILEPGSGSSTSHDLSGYGFDQVSNKSLPVDSGVGKNIIVESEQNQSLNTFLGQIYNDQNESLDFRHIDNKIGDNSKEQEEDDFGEFVSTEVWEEEGKVNSNSKDLFFDDQLGEEPKDTLFFNEPLGVGNKDAALFYDSQSVSSLELPPLTLSRHGSLPSLDLKIFPNSGERNATDIVFDLSPQGRERQVMEWYRCMESCLALLQSAVNTFSSVSSEQVLMEVLTAVEGRSYLQDLREVMNVCHRVEKSYRQTSPPDPRLDALLINIDSLGASLQPFYNKAGIIVEGECPDAEGSISAACGVCLAAVAPDAASGACRLTYAGHVYHAACANLWVNCVDCSLPALPAISGSGTLL